jgi:voltage-gated potassium channel Kch
MGSAVVKTGVAIVSIMAAGRLILRPVYRRIANINNAEIFAALTLLVVLGTSQLTSALGLSNALGAFLSGLLIAETEFALQVERDIAPYRGLLLGLFFMTVGMEIDFRILAANAGSIFAAIGAFLAMKVGIVSGTGPLFGLQPVTSARAAFFLAPGGEFAFVTFGEAVRNNLLSPLMSSQLTIVVALSMAATPWLAMLGSHLREQFSAQDARSLQPMQQEVDDMRGHVIVLGYGRVGQLIGQLMSEQLTEFVALDVRPERVAEGREKDMPVFFGDAGSPAVLKAVGADKAAAAVITLDTPSANYRSVWALKKHFPHVKTYVRSHDVDHGLLLEKAGATAVVPEILEPSLQLASAVLSELNLPADDVATALENFRRKHVQELKRLRSNEGQSKQQQAASSSAQSSKALSSDGNGTGPSPLPAKRSSATDLSDVPEEAVLQPALNQSSG